MSISIPTVSGINSALITFKKKGDVYRKKRRESNGLMIVRYGKFRYFMNDETFVSDPEHIVLIPAGADYSLICDDVFVLFENYQKAKIVKKLLFIFRQKQIIIAK